MGAGRETRCCNYEPQVSFAGCRASRNARRLGTSLFTSLVLFSFHTSQRNNVESAEAMPLLGTDDKSSMSRTDFFHVDGNTAPPASAGSSSPLEETVTASNNEPQASLTQVAKTETYDKTRGKKRKDKDVSLMTADASNKKKKRIEGPQKSICHLFVDSLRYFAMAASSMMLTIQIVPLAFFWRDTTWLQVAVK